MGAVAWRLSAAVALPLCLLLSVPSCTCWAWLCAGLCYHDDTTTGLTSSVPPMLLLSLASSPVLVARFFSQRNGVAESAKQSTLHAL